MKTIKPANAMRATAVRRKAPSENIYGKSTQGSQHWFSTVQHSVAIITLADVTSQIFEIPQNSPAIW